MRDWKPFVLSKPNLKKYIWIPRLKVIIVCIFCVFSSYNQNSSTILRLFYFGLYNSFDLFIIIFQV